MLLKFLDTNFYCFLFCSSGSSFVSDMMKCLHELLQVPINDISEQIETLFGAVSCIVYYYFSFNYEF